MKKTLSLLLAAVMMFGLLPVAVLAADAAPVEINAETYADSASVTLGGGKNYKLLAGERAVIDAGQTWTVSAGSTLYVYGYLDVKGTLTVNGYVTAIDSGEVTAKCWSDDNGVTYQYGKIVNSANVCGNETETAKRYFAEVYIPAVTKYAGFSDASHKLRVRYLTSRTGSEFDYLLSDLYYERLQSMPGDNDPREPKWYFADVYSSEDYNSSTGMLRVPLNQYLYLTFDFLAGGAPTKKYDGDRMAILFNRAAITSEQGVCTRLIDSAGAVDFLPKALLGTAGASYNTWKDSYFLRQERIYIPTGEGYSAFGINGEISAVDQTVRLNYGDEFLFRVTIDDKYSDSAYAVYLVQSYRWNERNHEDTLENLADEIYIDDNGNPQHFVWKFEEQKDGAQQKAYVDSYGVYHIAQVDDEYTIVVTGVASNDAISLSANIMDTIRNILNAIKQFFERVRQMLGLS